MTTLYDIPTKDHQRVQYQESSDEDEQEDGYEMTEFDLDVVDDALLNPNNSEYMDHFGFKIQVRTDDESSSDDDSNFGDSDHEIENKVPTASTTVTTTSDDDSIDLVTPHHFDDTNKKEFSNTKSPPTNVILKSPPTPRPEIKQQRSIDATTNRSSNESRHSILSSFNNPFSSTKRPTSVISIQSPVMPRPSQSFQQRQSKRYSEVAPHHMVGPPRSPESNHRHFDKLVSKFRRFSHNDHQYDSDKHEDLKQEALAEIKLYKEKGGIENNNVDWGKSLLKKNSLRILTVTYSRLLGYGCSKFWACH